MYFPFNCVASYCKVCSNKFKNVTKAYLLIFLQKIGKEANSNFRVVNLKDLLQKYNEFIKDKDLDTEFLTTTVTEKEKWQLYRFRLQEELGSENFLPNGKGT